MCRVPAGGACRWFPFDLHPLAPPTVPRNRSALVNAGWWLISVKNQPGCRLVDQSHGPYISCCSCQKQHNLPCFGSSNSSVATFSGKFQYNMASKQPAVIKVPDDDFPDSGPQNPVEAQSYRDQLDAIMSTFSDLLADDRKDALRSTIMLLKKLMVKHWWQMAKADMDVVLRSIHDSNCVYLRQHLTTEGVDVAEPATDVPEGWTFLRQNAQKGTEDRGLGTHHVMSSTTFQKRTPTCHRLRLTFPHWPRSADPETFNMVMKAVARLMIQVNVPEHYLSLVQDPPPEDHSRRTACPGWKKVILPQPCISRTGTMVQTYQASSCSGLALSQMQVFQRRVPPRRLALCLRCKPNNCQSCCRVRFTLVVIHWSCQGANISGLTLWPVREMSLVMEPPSSSPPPRSKRHCHWQQQYRQY